MTKPQTNSDQAEQKAIEWLTVLRSSSLTKQQEKRFFVWLEASAEHQKAFIAMEQLWQRGAALGQAKIIEENNTHSAIWKNLNLWYGAGFAAVCVLTVFIFVATPLSKSESQLYQTADLERREIELADGSVLNLNVNSQVLIDLNDSGTRRVTLKQGEVFFKVAHDATRPFKIDAQNSEIVVLGTQFSIAKRPDQTRVTVVNGKVQVTPKEHNKPQAQQAVILSRNQQSNISKDTMSLSTVDADQVLAWRTGMLRFNGNTLLEVVNELNRYYPEKIEIGDAILESMEVVAVLPLDRDLKLNLANLESNLNLVAVTDPASGIIRLLPVEQL